MFHIYCRLRGFWHQFGFVFLVYKHYFSLEYYITFYSYFLFVNRNCFDYLYYLLFVDTYGIIMKYKPKDFLQNHIRLSGLTINFFFNKNLTHYQQVNYKSLIDISGFEKYSIKRFKKRSANRSVQNSDKLSDS